MSAFHPLRTLASATKRSIFPDAAPFELSAHFPASRVRFTRIPACVRYVAWHTVPERVLTVRLDGSVEYETRDGEVRYVPAGSIVLVEDTHGKGHISRHFSEAQIVIWITLPDGLDLPPGRKPKRRCSTLLQQPRDNRDHVLRSRLFPRIGEVTVYAISIEGLTGKEMALPAASERWPALDRTKSPSVRLPEPSVEGSK